MSELRSVVIGLGSMGWGAAISLLRAGLPVAGVDVRPEMLEAFRSEGGTASSRPAEVAGNADVILVFVVNAAQTKTVLFGKGGALETSRKGTVFVLCATAAPTEVIDIARQLQAAGMLVLDAPVSGGHLKAIAGEITIMGSGNSEVFDAVLPVLDAISAKLFRLGEDIGLGSKVKMINQLLAGVHIAATAEALTLAASAGLDLKMVYDVIKVSAGSSWMFENRGAHIVDGDYTPRSTINIFVKDLGIVATEAGALRAEVPITTTALSLFNEALKEGLALEDDAAVAKVLARRNAIAIPGFDGTKR